MTPQMLLTLIQRRACCADCLLDKNQTCHLASAVFFSVEPIFWFLLLILLVAALFYKDYASLFRNNKELVKSLSP
ncbi:Phosphoethanolamine transferase EptA [Escherichia coli]|nr:Phosphoethanolamine transferase EptA [Escherichia coli]